jgi:hypothetical protein
VAETDYEVLLLLLLCDTIHLQRGSVAVSLSNNAYVNAHARVLQVKTAEPGFEYWVYIAFDAGDPFFDGRHPTLLQTLRQEVW